MKRKKPVQKSLRSERAAAKYHFAPGTSLETTWSRLRESIEGAISILEPDDYLIISSKVRDIFVQFAQGTAGMRVEAACLQPFEHAPSEATTKKGLIALGWKAPTYRSSPDRSHPPMGSHNYHIDVTSPVPCASVSSLAIDTLRTVFGVGHPDYLGYKSFCLNGEMIRFPTLGLTRGIPIHSTAWSPETFQ